MKIPTERLCPGCQELIREAEREYMRTYRGKKKPLKPLKEIKEKIMEPRDLPPPPILEEDGDELITPKIDPWIQKQQEWLKKGLCKHGKRDCSLC